MPNADFVIEGYVDPRELLRDEDRRYHTRPTRQKSPGLTDEIMLSAIRTKVRSRG